MRGIWAALLGLMLAALPARATPALWLVQGQHSKIYLFGTFHILLHPAPWFAGPVAAAFGRADTLWLEADIGSGGKLSTGELFREGLDADHDLWAELPERSAALFRAQLKQCGISPELVAGYKPWLAGLVPTICQIMAQSGGHGKAPGGRGPEAELTAKARQAGLGLRYFETAAEQIHYLADAPRKAQMARLVDAIGEAATGADDFAMLEDDWQAGKTEAIARLVAKMAKSTPEEYETLFTQRNRRFCTKIEALLATPQGGTQFVAIGAGHFAGPDSVLAMLAKDGITATRQ